MACQEPSPGDETALCPVCGSSELQLVEDMSASRKSLRWTTAGLAVNGLYETEGWDETSSNERVWCVDCNAEFDAPADLVYD